MSKSTPKLKISREEIRGIYAQGEEAVITLVEGLLKRIDDLETRVQDLENQRHKDSHNSSKPPSSNGLKQRTKSLRQKSERTSGGQKGHQGKTLEWSEEVDHTIVHLVSQCEGCGGSLEHQEVDGWEVRQVHDLPPLKLDITEHQVQLKCCEHCGILNRGQFPVDVGSTIQYGAGVKGLMVYLMEGQLLPSQRVCELLSEVFGCEVSQGTLYNTRQACHEGLESVESSIKAQIQNAQVSHFDETGMRVNGKLMWLHVACTDGLTFYFMHAKRGKIAMDEMNILPEFKGTSIHDGLASYKGYDCEHGLCNAHHLRELLFIVERYEQPWAEEMMTLLIEIKDQVALAKLDAKTALFPDQKTAFEGRYADLIDEGLKANPPPVMDKNVPKPKGRPKQSPPKNLLDRLDVHRSAVLAFMDDFRVPFDNNQAERDLRMMKLKQKISGGFRSFEGGRMFCRIRGYISTLRKRGFNVLESLRQVFRRNPPLPRFQAE